MAYFTMVVARYGDSFSMNISLPKSPYGDVKMTIPLSCLLRVKISLKIENTICCLGRGGLDA
jgi:hypothetical protein